MYPFFKTFESIIKVRLWGIMIASACLAVTVVFFAITLITWTTAVFVHLKSGWIDSLVNWGVGILIGIGGWFMLPVLIILIGGIFQEYVIDRVERVYYPDKIRNTPPKFWPDFRYDIQFILLALFLNLLVMPFYLFGIGFFISIALNSYLLGREFFESAAGYHVGKPQARHIGKQHRAVIYSGGCIITVMTLVPLLNLFVPILAIVWMVHVYNQLLNT